VYNVTCQFGATVEIDARIVARDTMLALATIDVFEGMLGATGASFHAPVKWPPSPVSFGEVVSCEGGAGNG
jgi:hypothetical protein